MRGLVGVHIFGNRILKLFSSLHLVGAIIGHSENQILMVQLVEVQIKLYPIMVGITVGIEPTHQASNACALPIELH